MVFDINAEIEPVNEEDYQVINYDYGEIGETEAEVVGEEHENALKACSALRFSQNRLSDLRPVDSDAQLEYSYRPLDGISQFWAGPSHWKFRRTTNVRRPLSQIQEKENNLQKKKSTKNAKKMPLDFFSFSKNEDKDFVPVNSTQAKKVKKIACYNEPNPKKQTLPNDLKVNSSTFEYFCHAPAILNKIPTPANANIESKEAVASNEPVSSNEEQQFDVRNVEKSLYCTFCDLTKLYIYLFSDG